jgi:adenine-specific DNA-methyltransferase
LKKVLTGGKDVKRYHIHYSNLSIIYTKRNDNFHELPNICRFIDKYKNEITCKEVKSNKHPIYSLHRPRNENIFLKDNKLIGVITNDRIILCLDDKKYYLTDGLFMFGVKNTINIKYLLSILNSKLFILLYRLFSFERGRVLAQVKPIIIKQLPIRTIDFSDPADKGRHDRLVEMVENMLAWHKELAAAKTPQEKTLLERQIAGMDKDIDRLVYELYDLNDEEIALVEGN